MSDTLLYKPKQLFEWVNASEPGNFPESLELAVFRDAETLIPLSANGYVYFPEYKIFKKLNNNGNFGKFVYKLSEVEWLKPLSEDSLNDTILKANQEEFNQDFVDVIKETVVNECRDKLLKQMFLMTYKNGYPSEAVPKATVLSLPKLMKVYPQANLLQEENENLKKQLREQIVGAAMSEQSLLELNRKVAENLIDKAIAFCDGKIADGFSDAENYPYEQMKQYLQTLK